MSRIREIRIARGLSVKDLASKAGVTRMSIYRYEEKGTIPRFSTVGKIAKALGVKIEELFAEETDKTA